MTSAGKFLITTRPPPHKELFMGDWVDFKIGENDFFRKYLSLKSSVNESIFCADKSTEQLVTGRKVRKGKGKAAVLLASNHAALSCRKVQKERLLIQLFSHVERFRRKGF